MAGLTFGGKQPRTLDFDIEARPLSWLGGDFVTREVTAIAARFLDEDDTYCWALGEDTTEDMLLGFKVLYDNADIVTGHYIRGYDLPGLNDALMEFGLPQLGPKWSVDTKLDLRKGQGVSKSQESLGAMLGLDHPKIQMSQSDWRAANRLSPEGVAKTKRRVIGDVEQHIEMLAELRWRGDLLGPGKLWSPGPGKNAAGYTP
jgi:hypothetical protein